MSDVLVTAGILAAGILYIVALLYLIRWASLGLIWLSRAITGRPRYFRPKEPYNAVLDVPRGIPGAPLWGPSAKYFFLFTALGIAYWILMRYGFAAMGWEWPFGR